MHNRNINYGHKVLISKLKKEIDCQITIILDKPLKKNRIFFILELYKYIDRKVFSIFSNIQDPFKLVNLDSSQKKISFNEFNKSNEELNLILDLRENQENQECLLAKKIWRLNPASFNNFFSDVVNKNRSIKTYLVQTMENKTSFILHESLNRVTKYSFHINRSEIYLGWVDRLHILISTSYYLVIVRNKTARPNGLFFASWPWSKPMKGCSRAFFCIFSNYFHPYSIHFALHLNKALFSQIYIF